MDIVILILVLLCLVVVVGSAVYFVIDAREQRKAQEKRLELANEKLLRALSESFRAHSARSIKSFATLAETNAKLAEKITTNTDRVDNVGKVVASLNEEIEATLDILKVVETSTRITEENAALLAKHKDYRQMFGMMLEVLQEDTEWLRSNFFQRFGSVPEYQDLNSQIIQYQTKLMQVKNTLREFRMLEEYDE